MCVCGRRYSDSLRAGRFEIESRWVEIFRPDRPWGQPIDLYNGYRVIPGEKRQGRCVDHMPHITPRLKKE